MKHATIAALTLLAVVSAKETLIFEENFDTFNFTRWQHEITLSGGGNWEFEWYTNNRSNSYVKNSTLYIKPTLTEDYVGHQTLVSGSASIWGGGPAEYCTQNDWYGCERNAAASGNVLNPVRSARIRTVNSFSTKYGRVEVKAKLPRGDWLWPAIWMLPTYQEYGKWPASGEIDIMESRGNDASYPNEGVDTFGSTLHWGTNWDTNKYSKTHKSHKHTESLNNAFHIYGLYWDENKLYTYLDDENTKVLEVDFTEKSFFERGEFPSTMDNPWVGENNAAPFNREFHLILNLAIGGTNGYFPDGQGGKPWADGDSHSVNAFWNAKGAWYPTW